MDSMSPSGKEENIFCNSETISLIFEVSNILNHVISNRNQSLIEKVQKYLIHINQTKNQYQHQVD